VRVVTTKKDVQLPKRRCPNVKWTEQELSILREKKAAGLRWQEVSEWLPGRSQNGCEQQYQRLSKTMKQTPTTAPRKEAVVHPRTENQDNAASGIGTVNELVSARHIPWTSQEEATLFNNRDAGLPYQQIASFLPRRSVAACRGHYYKKWGGVSEQHNQRKAPKKRSRKSAQQRRRRPTMRPRWTPEDIRMVKACDLSLYQRW
jgi:hypothetical protein